jgi:hypothetical protein
MKRTTETHIPNLRHQVFFCFEKTANGCFQAVLQLVKRVETPEPQFKLERRVFVIRPLLLIAIEAVL